MYRQIRWPWGERDSQIDRGIERGTTSRYQGAKYSAFGMARRTNPSADLDEETLKTIASLTGGQYFRAKDTAGLQEIYRILDEMEPVVEPEAGFRPIKSFFYWPLGAAMVLATLLALINLLARVRLGIASMAKTSAG